MFEKSIAAIQRREASQWEIGDALLEELGPPASHGIHDGSRNSVQALITEIQELGIEGYSSNYIAQLRIVSQNFDRVSRETHLSWSIHRVSGSPRILERIKMLAARRGIKLTQRAAEQLKREIELDQPPTLAETQAKLREWLDPIEEIEHSDRMMEEIETKWNAYLTADQIDRAIKSIEARRVRDGKLIAILTRTKERIDV